MRHRGTKSNWLSCDYLEMIQQIYNPIVFHENLLNKWIWLKNSTQHIHRNILVRVYERCDERNTYFRTVQTFSQSEEPAPKSG